MWPFRTAIIDDDAVLWQFHAFQWLIEAHSSRRPLASTKLVTPGLGHFVADGEKGHRFAQLIFDQARRHAGLDDAAIRLVAQRPRAQETIGDTVALITPKPLPLGTFSAHREATTITYDPALTDDPEMLIATFAHELAHVLTPPDSELPVEADEYELFTDLTSAFLGFGVFLSNTRLERYVDDGWIKWRGAEAICL